MTSMAYTGLQMPMPMPVMHRYTSRSRYPFVTIKSSWPPAMSSSPSKKMSFELKRSPIPERKKFENEKMMQMTDIINGMTGNKLGQPEQAQPQTAQQPQPKASAITEGGGGDRGEKLANKARERAQSAAGVK